VLDLLVENCVIVETKCVKKLTDLDVAQLLTYLRLTNLGVGLLINVNVTKLKHGLRRVVNRHVDADGNLLRYKSLTEGAPEDRVTTNDVDVTEGQRDDETY
jgi:hypothetical protein